MEILASPYTWVIVAFVGFIALVWKPAGSAILNALDGRSRRIQQELDEATRLREEAQEVLVVYQKKQAESLKEAEEIIAKASQDADRLRADAEAALKGALDARMKLAMEKIAQSEAKALQDVQNHVVDIAISAARSIILEHMDKTSGQELVQFAIADIERKIH